ncbi:polysaccharide lyase [Candidatus Sumerlaeota bacterium]|nr:polysaccharide lyase [Candidatus Sumerlaeota bacterium]
MMATLAAFLLAVQGCSMPPCRGKDAAFGRVAKCEGCPRAAKREGCPRSGKGNGCPGVFMAPPTNLIPAFPGAEGFGAYTYGGRKGAILEVTSLEDDGSSGTLRWALESRQPRIVVFRVSGLITLTKPISIGYPYITVAGQTAPGDGICVRGESVHIDTHDVVIRYMRFRRGPALGRDDSLGGNPIANVMVDHCSCSWGLDENVSIYRQNPKCEDGFGVKMPTRNVTIQWTISSEALNPNNHAFGGTWGGRHASFHHNLFACNTGRNPSIGWGDLIDYRNNVIFNWRHRTMDGGGGNSPVNVVANYFKPGPAVNQGPIQYRIAKVQHFDNPGPRGATGRWYVAGNVVEGFPEVTADNWKGMEFDDDRENRPKEELVKIFRVDAPTPALPIFQQSAEKAYKLVLAGAGATLPKRDPVDERIVEAVRTGKPTVGNGIVNDPAEVGGWPEYKSADPPVDTDHDGMPDEWEIRYGFDPNGSEGHKTRQDGPRQDNDRDGHTNVEEYLNNTDPTEFVDYLDPKNNVSSL